MCRRPHSRNIGTQQAAAAEADGYTLLLAFDGTMVIALSKTQAGGS